MYECVIWIERFQFYVDKDVRLVSLSKVVTWLPSWSGSNYPLLCHTELGAMIAEQQTQDLPAPPARSSEKNSILEKGEK